MPKEKETYLRFAKVGTSATGKTNIYHVISAYDQTLLGYITWNGGWRRYVFVPNKEIGTQWSDDCLDDLSAHIKKIMGEWRNAKKKKDL